MKHLLRARQTWLIVALVAAAAMFIATFTNRAKADVLCDLEASVGVGVAKTNVASTLDLGSAGALGGLGAGCDAIKSGQFVFGLMGRASLMDVTGKIGPLTLKDTYLYEGAARAGFVIHEKYTLYGLAGYSWEDLQLSSISKTHPNGLLLGGGIDYATGIPGVSSRLEYTWHDFQGQHLGALDGAKVQPDLHVVRAALVWHFPTASTAADAPAPKRTKKLCDAKLANC